MPTRSIEYEFVREDGVKVGVTARRSDGYVPRSFAEEVYPGSNLEGLVSNSLRLKLDQAGVDVGDINAIARGLPGGQETERGPKREAVSERVVRAIGQGATYSLLTVEVGGPALVVRSHALVKNGPEPEIYYLKGSAQGISPRADEAIRAIALMELMQAAARSSQTHLRFGELTGLPESIDAYKNLGVDVGGRADDAIFQGLYPRRRFLGRQGYQRRAVRLPRVGLHADVPKVIAGLSETFPFTKSAFEA